MKTTTLKLDDGRTWTIQVGYSDDGERIVARESDGEIDDARWELVCSSYSSTVATVSSNLVKSALETGADVVSAQTDD